ncbi:Aste57867_997 [Aphanomyces stellatus]|uniref:Aste57867_997 protein n=1 Tax=Aphanomyces stellatus TaxID=120398 RepID=A0A485K7D2_9STRA|nr:hypothetical protein As57867_000996 [Aphanomyces stellatus]VFT78219.1 Aste57867_997 [Aphanomyces stellatus]
MPDVIDVVLVISCVLTCYTPVAFGLYLRHMDHPSIKYREPRLMALVCAISIVQCMGQPLVALLDSAWPCAVTVVFGVVLPTIASVTFLVAQGSVVVMFAITEMLVLPQQHAPHTLRRIQWYRWLLYRPVQWMALVTGCVVVVTPLVIVVPSRLWQASTSTCAFDDDTMQIVTTTLLTLWGVVALYLTAHLSAVVDNFGLRQSYHRTIGTVVLGGTIAIIVSQPTVVDPAVTRSLYPILATWIHHVVLVFNLVLPVRQLGTSRRFVDSFDRSFVCHTTLVVRRIAIHPAPSSSFVTGSGSMKPSHLRHRPSNHSVSYSKLHAVAPTTHVATIGSGSLRLPSSNPHSTPAKDIHALASDLHLFLTTPAGFDALLAYAHRHAHTQELLAWALIEKYKRALVTAQMVYDTCLAPHSLLWTQAAADVGPRLVARRLSLLAMDATASPTLFDEVTTKLLRTIYLKLVVGGFRHEDPAWDAFQKQLKTMDLLESVVSMTKSDKGGSSLRQPPPALDRRRGSSVALDLHNGGGRHSQMEVSQPMTSVGAFGRTESMHKSDVSQHTITR